MFWSSVLSFALIVVLLSANGIQGEVLEPYFSHENANSEEESKPYPDYNRFPSVALPGKLSGNHFSPPGNQPYSNRDKHESMPNQDKNEPEFSTALSVPPFNTELFYRLDIVPCPSTSNPGPGKSRVYQTWIIFSSSYGFHCWAQVVRTTAIQPVQDQSNPIYIVKSENYGKSPYYPRRVQYFNIQCPSRGYIQTMTTDLERRTKLTIGSSSTYYCADYVQIDYKSQGRCEMCGNETVSSNGCPPYFYSDGINITFRTSQFNNYKGFSMTVVCYEGSEQDLPGCIQTLPAWTEKSTTGQGDSQEYYSINQKYLPANAEDELLNFYKNYVESPHTLSVEDHYNTLRLAVLSENSCSAVLRSIGREVAEMFPAVMVMQAKINELGWDYE